MDTKIMLAPAAIGELAKQGLDLHRVDQMHDVLQLVGRVIALITLLEISVGSSDEKARVSASKELLRLEEDPEVIVSRLKAAPFAEYSAKQLQYLVDQLTAGRLDLEELYKEAEALETES